MKKLFTLLIAILAVGAMQINNLQAQTTVTQTTPGTYTFTLPAGVATMTVECWGAGGAGGSVHYVGSSALPRVSGGGGAGGSYAKTTFTSPVSGNYNYTVGAGGVGIATGFTNDVSVSGTSTTFTGPTNVVAIGGAGGQAKYVTTVTPTYGVGGAKAVSGGTGTLTYIGGAGGTGSAPNTGIQYSGGGGGSAGAGTTLVPNGDGGDASTTNNTAGAAGSGGGIIGAAGISSTGSMSDGVQGGVPGAGGSGAILRPSGNQTNAYRKGGNGGNGTIKITYYYKIELTSPTNKAVYASGISNITLTATATPGDGRSITSVVFKDGGNTISGEVTDLGSNNYSLVYNTPTDGTHTITASYTDDLSNTFTSSSRSFFVGNYKGNKYARANITWATGPWYNDLYDGVEVSAPTEGDNVFTENYVITVDADAICDSLTLGKSPNTPAAANTITISADKTLTVRGVINAYSLSSAAVFGSSNATSILKLTGAVIPTPGSGNVILSKENATQSISPKNVTYAAVDSRVYQIQPGVGNYSINIPSASVANSGKMIVKSGTSLVTAMGTILGQGTENELIVEAGATFTVAGTIRGTSTNVNYHVTKATINGTVLHTGGAGFSIYNLVLGASGIFKTNAGPGATATMDGWWAANGTAYATPGVVSFAAGSTIEFNKNAAQNINGIIPENILTGYTATPTIAAYTMPYSNLIISGSGTTKTVQSNLTATGNLTVGYGVTMATATDVTATVNGVVLNFGTITGTVANTKTINVSSSDVLKGAVSGSVTGSVVSLVATPISGFVFVNWTEASSEISTSAILPAFTAESTRTLVANFVVDPSTELSTTKANAFVTVVGNTLKLNGDVTAVDVFDAQGRRLVSQANVTSVNVPSKGIYIVKMRTAQGVNTQKVNVNKI